MAALTDSTIHSF